jgi:hypothetical protein
MGVICTVGGIASLIGLKQLWLMKIGLMTPLEAGLMILMGLTLLGVPIYAFLPARKEKSHSAKS